MARSAILRDLIAGEVQRTILTVLVARFGRGAEALQCELNPITNERRLQQLAKHAAVCPDLGTFRKRLGTRIPKQLVTKVESLWLTGLIAERKQAAIRRILVDRFGPGARALRPALKAIKDKKQLVGLLIQATTNPDLESFKKLLEP